MEQQTFKEWLAARVGEGGQVSRRELARRLAGKYQGDAESHRRSIRRILDGERNPTQTTRDSIQDVLDDWSAPRVDDEVADQAISHDELATWQRVNRKLAMRTA